MSGEAAWASTTAIAYVDRERKSGLPCKQGLAGGKRAFTEIRSASRRVRHGLLLGDGLTGSSRRVFVTVGPTIRW
jgi:hypothetical protein